MFTIFLTDLDFDQYNAAHQIIFGVPARYNGYMSDLTSHNIECDIECEIEFDRCCLDLFNANIAYTL